MSAYGGVVSLATGVIDMGPAIEDRFPFGSHVFAAVSLALVVAAPMTVVAQQAATGGTRASGAAVAAGALLVGWIVVQIAVIRSVSWLQPTMAAAAAGAGVLLAGLRPSRRRPTS